MQGPFIFLDIDGVLNNRATYWNGYTGIDPRSMHVLNNILDITKASVVIASAWRYMVIRQEMTLDGFNGMMATHGMQRDAIVDILCPDIKSHIDGEDVDRGAGILDWFGNQYPITQKAKWIAIDDLDLGYSRRQMPFVQTDGNKGLRGLTDKQVQGIIDHLGRKVIELRAA